ncbi:hypothetical protein RclHR1_00160016 [Rhizophagus clarus]|uniref:Ricin B lectin domain-containing protein n=1 Tax=Rhizophagus clarus TaxID=94130 RepID=A0A2Z6QGK2_9GLOM|nr:hypothetical protein RclHR1_00160016 [Rhizophagus clarus]GES81099.1 hypothetical protein GLOIN_2v1669614 [Rhizophagus clarus]
MKFNFLLLLLTSLIAVTLSQQRLDTSKIQSYSNGLFWTSVGGVRLVLKGVDWRFTYYNESSVLISPSEISPPGNYVQYNGPEKQLSIVNITNTVDFPPQVLWEIRPSPLKIYPPLFYICIKFDPSMCATAVETGIVIANSVNDERQFWIFDKS